MGKTIKEDVEEALWELEEYGDIEELNPESDMTWGETEELGQARELGIEYEGDEHDY